MYIAFEFGNGSNPYVTITGEKLFHMFCKYYTEQFTSNTFVVLGEREWNGNRQTKQGRKEVRELSQKSGRSTLVNSIIAHWKSLNGRISLKLMVVNMDCYVSSVRTASVNRKER